MGRDHWAMAFIGIVFMVLVYFPLRGRPPFLVILTTIAMGIVLENLRADHLGTVAGVDALAGPWSPVPTCRRRHFHAPGFHFRDTYGNPVLQFLCLPKRGSAS